VSVSTSLSDSANASASLSDSASISSALNHSQAPAQQPAGPGHSNGRKLPNTGTASNQFAGLGLGVAALATASLLGKKKKSAASEMDLED